MVLFTLLGLYALFQRERNQVNSSHSGQDEIVEQNDDGQTSSQNITSDPEDSDYQSLEEPFPDDPEVDDDCCDDSVYYSLADDTVAPQLIQQEDDERTIMVISSCRYEMGNQLGKGGFGAVHAATRLEDGLQVAVKFASKEKAKYISVDGYSRPVPLEVALHMFANQEPRVPQIIQLLDWQEEADRYVMVLERPVPCQSLSEFIENHTGVIDEDLARVIMRQVTLAAQTCCQRGVFHRDIKMENLLINPDTLEVKLIDFGCGDILTEEGYTSFAGTEVYFPPEYWIDKKYHGEPTTVWSLGTLLFVMVCGNFPRRRDTDKFIKDNNWTNDGLSQECCDLLCCCLRLDTKKRIELDKVSLHNWFKMKQ